MAIGFLYNSKDYKYPKGKLFYDQDGYDEALANGWDTGPVDKAKAKMKAEWEAETVKEVKIEHNEPFEVTEEEVIKPKPKPKSRRRKK